jgi:hypothetical protein
MQTYENGAVRASNEPVGVDAVDFGPLALDDSLISAGKLRNITWYWAESLLNLTCVCISRCRCTHDTLAVSSISSISHPSLVWVPSIVTWHGERKCSMSALNVLFAETRVVLGVMPCYSWTGWVMHSILVGFNRPARLLPTCSQVSSYRLCSYLWYELSWPLLRTCDTWIKV